MSPADEVFNCEMELATYRRMVDTDAYWRGYATGLMRARFGCIAVPDWRHYAWSLADAPGERARGYRDGYARLAAILIPGPAGVREQAN